MKTLNKKILFFQIIAILGISMLFSLNGKSAEFVILNDTISYPNATDNNGFYFFYWNSSMPVNWKSPVDYYNGQVYTRYEIITQVTSEPIGFQFGVWMKLPPVTGTLYEDMESVRHLNGPGTFITSNSSPASWWKFNGGSDFTQMNNVWHFGINPYKVDPFEQQIRSENAATWAERFTLWFPMTVRVTVVAVSSGATFSGWDNYTRFATPAYTINYGAEKTNQVVPATDEYSYSPSMTPAYSGTGAQLSLTPGQTVYFRTKAKDNTPQSNIQTLTVPARPSITAFSIDYTNVRTNEVVSSNVVYSTAADFSSQTAGTGERVTLTPGQDLYLKINPTASTFASQTIHLVVPARPDAPTVNINYVNETTNEVLSSTVEYAVNVSMTGAVSCANDEVTLTPGTDLYFRYKPTASSFGSSVTTLDVPSRPAAPAITINYSTELSSAVGTTLEWSLNESFSTATQGLNAGITLTPGANVYIRVKATSGSFSSAAQLLVVPSRPATPNITINYENEKTSAVGSTLQWSLFSSMSAATDGQGTTLSLTPGTDLYFRVKGTASSFTSGVQHLDVPSRPLMPVFTINYIDETTNEVVSQNVEYSVSSGFLSVNYGSGAELELIPGTDLFFRQKNTASSFRSAASELVIPERNILGYSGNDTVNTYFTMYAIIFDESFEFSLNSLSIANAVANNLRDGNIFDIHPATMGDVIVKIPASPTCFKSNEVKVFYNGPTAINQPELAQVNIFPNPVSEGFINIDTYNDQPFTIEVISAEGKILKRFENYGSENNLVDLSGFSSGLYLIKIYFTDQVSINKIFIE